jgi:hypothetical protein
VRLGHAPQVGWKLIPRIVRRVQLIPHAMVPIEPAITILSMPDVRIAATVAVIWLGTALAGRS